MNHSTVIPIENLRIWTGGSWVKCTVKSNLLLRIHYDQLLITCEDKILESLNTNKNLKGIIKDDILILIVNANGQEKSEIRKRNGKVDKSKSALTGGSEVIATDQVLSYCKTDVIEVKTSLAALLRRQKVRKIKFQIRQNLFQCLQELKARFPVVSYGSTASKCKVTTKYDNLGDIFKRVLEDKAIHDVSPMPENFSSFVKLCLLDPMFPQLVQQTKQILDTEILNKDSSV